MNDFIVDYEVNYSNNFEIFNKKTYVIVSKWGYPFGGGESFLYTTVEWATKLGMFTYWLCFTDAKNVNYSALSLDSLPNGYIIRIPDGFDENVLYNWLRLLRPDYIHHQGHMRKSFFDVCEKLRIEFLSGFHFWHGAIILDSVKLNKDILLNYKDHKVDPELIYLYNRKYCNLYTVSPFVSECIKTVSGYEINDNIYSSSSITSTKIENMDIRDNKFVTMINIHYLKGGEILLYLIENCPNIPFMAIRTEHLSEELDKKISDAIKKRNETGIKCILFERLEDPKIIYRQTKILLATSNVDETFCRVVNEAMMNGIPIMSTGQGNIKNLMGESGYILPYDDKEAWRSTLENIYNNKEELKIQSDKTLLEYENYSEKKAFNLFKNISKKVILKSKERNVMIFTPWCDQGLGIQSRNYANILNSKNYNVFIFGLKPYNANSCIELQKDPEEWVFKNENNNNIYYSNNDRESVTDDEIISFVKKYNIGKCLIPETCWFRVFEVAELLNILNVKCYAIPNIEIVRYDELYKHNCFYKILCNNKLCENLFNKHGINKTEYIGYGINYDISIKSRNINEKIKFLFIGGMNAFSRKHIIEICQGFTKAYEKNKNISLTCTIQKTNLLEENIKQQLDMYINHEAITFIQTHLSHNEIFNLYYTHHISIQVSKHEGLGLGFYESLATGTPIITLDIQPHNEIVLDNINGWLIPCYCEPMTDNLHSLLQSAHFKPYDLTKKIQEICDNPKIYDNIIKTLIIDYTSRLHVSNFQTKFIRAIS